MLFTTKSSMGNLVVMITTPTFDHLMIHHGIQKNCQNQKTGVIDGTGVIGGSQEI
jgi:hypothetical protein